MNERMKKLRRYITGCTALLLIPAMALLTGCGNDAQVDSVAIAESVETTESTETIRR